jgi:UDP-N-acetylmuramate dehydrogenase
VEIRTSVPLAPYTTLGLGGPARFFAECRSPEEVRETLRHASSRRLRVFVLAGGSNVLFPDRGFDGLVLHLAGDDLSFDDAGSHVLAHAWAGTDWDTLVQAAARRRLGGVECLSGIPGSAGATPVQNVGAYGQEVADTITSVRAIERGGFGNVEFSGDECRFGYRRSRFKGEDAGRYVITGVTFRLEKNARPAVRYPELMRALERTAGAGGVRGGEPTPEDVREAVLALRRGKSMVLDPSDPDTRSAGSFFTNPVLSPGAFADLERRWKKAGGAEAVPSFLESDGIKVPAAWLVERSGFPKGYRKGNAAVSTKHALALVNRGCTAAELLALADEIRAGVRTTFGVQLEPEPVIVPSS